MKSLAIKCLRVTSPQDRIRLLMLLLVFMLADALYWSVVH